MVQPIIMVCRQLCLDDCRAKSAARMKKYQGNLAHWKAVQCMFVTVIVESAIMLLFAAKLDDKSDPAKVPSIVYFF